MHGTAALDRINTAERRILFFLRTTTLFSVYYLGKGIIFQHCFLSSDPQSQTKHSTFVCPNIHHLRSFLAETFY